ncbi:MAG: hypothetical protein KatS3mg068_1255 [Candidatus Sericytochromatia bacterium]|nr:MAG: hypothetical protein KatS3mg068_1255 [Candidatus Sericytochromatia bacterium]
MNTLNSYNEELFLLRFTILRIQRYLQICNNFGRFFNPDKNIQSQVLNWLNNYYLKEGNPIGKDQDGINQFINQFGNFLKIKSQSKARQIIDTSVSYIKSSSTIL